MRSLTAVLVVLTSSWLWADATVRPALIYSNAFGGQNTDIATAVALDSAGNAYVAGYTTSPDFPVKNGFQPQLNGTQNAFVTKWSADGKQILYSTYLGGSKQDYATAIAVDAAGNAYVTGYTTSTDFPVTASALQPKMTGQTNAFVTQIAPDGSRVVYSSFLGGFGRDTGNAITLDSAGNVFLTGYAASADFPVTPNVLQPKLKQGCSTNNLPPQGNAFVAKLDLKKPALLYSTYLGGSCGDEGLGIAVDAAGNAYVAGVTRSSDFPVTKGAFQTTFNLPAFESGNAGFLAKLTPQGDGLVYATFFSRWYSDAAHAVAVDSQGAAYVTGSSPGLGDTLTGGVCGLGYTALGLGVGINGAPYVYKLNPTGSALVYERSLGGEFGAGTSISVDKNGQAWVAGTTAATPYFGGEVGDCLGLPSSFSFPTVHPFQALGTGLGFVSQISVDGATLLFSSLLDYASAVALDGNGNAFVAGNTRSVSFPKQSPSGWMSAVLVRIDGAVNSAVTLEAPQKLSPVHICCDYYSDESYGTSVVAPGAVLTLAGAGLGPDQEVDASGGKFPTSLAGVSVTFDGIPAPLLSVQAQKIVLIVPFGISDRTQTTIQAAASGAVSNAIRVPVSPTAVELLAVLNQDGTPHSSNNPAAPGSVVTIYAAGLGQTNPPGVDGAINGTGTLKTPITVSINAQLLYAGPAPGEVAGISQINFLVPQLPPNAYWLSVGWSDQYLNEDAEVVPFWIGKQ